MHALVLAVLATVAGAGSWATGAERTVVRAGLMQGGALDQPFRAGEAQLALDALAARAGAPAVRVGGGRLSVARLHHLLVAQVGLGDLAAAVQAEAARAGLRPPPRFGTEVVARQLNLRVNHAGADEALEPYPWDPVSRAEAAWSFARALQLDGRQQAYAREVLGRFSLPRYSGRQLRPLRVAVSRIGMPYIWGGDGDSTRGADGPQARGGYDCSGFVWRVFKTPGSPAGRAIGDRTAAGQAGEIPRSARLRIFEVRPGDLLFFGPASFGSRATEKGITHEGIALSGEFMIHSSSAGAGVYVAPLFEPWRVRRFSWGRRVL
ncbi:MAG TPA: NlpC/P60 family protein [Solirubrobacteraceae bacterium]|nr:NlpC/P60 family protein [Solirubrobacteraceae bacterium]